MVQQPGMMVRACNPSDQKAEAKGPKVQSVLGCTVRLCLKQTHKQAKKSCSGEQSLESEHLRLSLAWPSEALTVCLPAGYFGSSVQ